MFQISAKILEIQTFKVLFPFFYYLNEYSHISLYFYQNYRTVNCRNILLLLRICQFSIMTEKSL